MNIHEKTVNGFGEEWEHFDQSELAIREKRQLFDRYFKIFPWDKLAENSIGFDMGCGSGRWALLVAPKVGLLHCIDPSSAIEVARRNLKGLDNCVLHLGCVSDNVLPPKSMDFGYSLGVLHHVPDTKNAIESCVNMLKPGAPFLVYLYYAFDNKPFWYRMLWKVSDCFRIVISSLNKRQRFFICHLIAAFVYWPLSKIAKVLSFLGGSDKILEYIPLSAYMNCSFYTMRTDALDRFGTVLEKRFSKMQIKQMMEEAGLEDIKFSSEIPYWCAIGYRRK